MHRRTWGTSLLLGLLVLGTSLSTSALPASAQPVALTAAGATAATASAPTKFESDILMYINNHRAKIGCPRLSYNSYLAYAARQHNARMVAARQVSHQLYPETSLATRITAAGYTPWRILAENLAAGTRTPWSTYALWMHSPAHKANIENCGVRNAGVASAWVNGASWDTIDFGRQ